MPQYGLTPQGYVVTPLQVFKEQLENAFRGIYGQGINLDPRQPPGQMIGILADAFARQDQKAKEVYDSFNPNGATGVSLDNVASLTAIKRLEATFSTGQGIAYGDVGTIIKKDFVISVAGNPLARFKILADQTIGPGTDEVQSITFSDVPDEGTFTLVFDGEETAAINWNDNAAAVESALNNLSALSGASVSGSFATQTFAVTFTGADGQKDQPLLTVGSNSLKTATILLAINITEDTPGALPNVLCDVIAETAGAIPAYANTLTVIETPTAGWTAFNNPSDITIGRDIESDAAFRLRRNITLSTAGNTTVDAIRSHLLEIDEVTSARVFENDDDVTDLQGRPPHSFEAVVEGGDDQEIVDVIWASKAAGIQTYGSSSGVAIDSMLNPHTIYFSRPTPIDIYIKVTLTTDGNFPINGDQAVKEALAAYGQSRYSIGDDVLWFELFCPLTEINGILTADIRIDFTPSPTGTANLPIADNERAHFDTTLIDVIIV